MPGKTFDIRGIPEAKKLLAGLSGRELQNRTRRGTRKGAALFRKQIRARAAGRSDLPKSFKKTQTRNHRNPIGTSVGPSSSLWHIFEGGADGHTIAPGSGGSKFLLSGRAGERGRTKGFVASEPVWHPGMGARPLTVPIFNEFEGQAAHAAMDEILAGLH